MPHSILGTFKLNTLLLNLLKQIIFMFCVFLMSLKDKPLKL